MKQGRQPAGTQSPRFAPKARRTPSLSERGGWLPRRARNLQPSRMGGCWFRAPARRARRSPAATCSAQFPTSGTRFADGGCFCASPNLRGACPSLRLGHPCGRMPARLAPRSGRGRRPRTQKSPTAFKSNRVIKNRPLEAVGFRLYFIRRPRFLRHPHPSEELQQF